MWVEYPKYIPPWTDYFRGVNLCGARWENIYCREPPKKGTLATGLLFWPWGVFSLNKGPEWQAVGLPGHLQHCHLEKQLEVWWTSILWYCSWFRNPANHAGFLNHQQWVTGDRHVSLWWWFCWEISRHFSFQVGGRLSTPEKWCLADDPGAVFWGRLVTFSGAIFVKLQECMNLIGEVLTWGRLGWHMTMISKNSNMISWFHKNQGV